MGRISYAFVLVFTLALIGCSESKEDYNKRASAFVDSVTSEAEVNLAVAGNRVATWSNAIFDNHKTDPMTGEATAEYVFDFNIALAEFNESAFIKTVKEARDVNKKKLDSVYATIKEAPSDAAGPFDAAKDIYATYLKTYGLAFDPKGSLQSYREEVISTRSKLAELKSAFDLEAK